MRPSSESILASSCSVLLAMPRAGLGIGWLLFPAATTCACFAASANCDRHVAHNSQWAIANTLSADVIWPLAMAGAIVRSHSLLASGLDSSSGHDSPSGPGLGSLSLSFRLPGFPANSFSTVGLGLRPLIANPIGAYAGRTARTSANDARK